MTVRFLQAHTPYKKGDIAGVSDELGEKLVKAKIAEEVKGKQAPAKEPETKQVDEAPRNKQVQAAPRKK